MKKALILIALSAGATIAVNVFGTDCVTIGLLTGIVCILIDGKENPK